jgi:hypothetical protein
MPRSSVRSRLIWKSPRSRRNSPIEATAAEFLKSLERETLASLRQDPGRWPWRHSKAVPDNRRLREGRRAEP